MVTLGSRVAATNLAKWHPPMRMFKCGVYVSGAMLCGIVKVLRPEVRDWMTWKYVEYGNAIRFTADSKGPAKFTCGQEVVFPGGFEANRNVAIDKALELSVPLLAEVVQNSVDLSVRPG